MIKTFIVEYGTSDQCNKDLISLELETELPEECKIEDEDGDDEDSDTVKD